MFFANGDFYKGEIENGDFHGYGVFSANSNDCEFNFYNGMWFKGVPHEKGMIKYVSGYLYWGEFQYGVRYGEGILYFPNGGVEEGRFVKGVFKGEKVFCEDGGVVSLFLEGFNKLFGLSS